MIWKIEVLMVWDGQARRSQQRSNGKILGLVAVASLSVVLLSGCSGPDSSRSPLPRKIVDLSPVITEDLPVRQLGRRATEFLGVRERLRFTPIHPAREQYSFGLTYFELPSHIGAHLDAPGRLLKGGERADQIPLDRVFGPARLIDLRWKDRHSPIRTSDLENYTVRADDVVLLFIGYTQPQEDDWPTYAPLSVEAAEWLTARKVKAVATDMPSIGSMHRYAELLEKDRPPEEVWAERLVLFHAGIAVIEGLTNLGHLVDEPSVVFVGFPLAVADRSGAPMRAAALVY